MQNQTKENVTRRETIKKKKKKNKDDARRWKQTEE